MFRLVNHSIAALMYVIGRAAVVFNYLVNNRFNITAERPVCIQWLEPNKKYTVKEMLVSRVFCQRASDKSIFKSFF
jgi:hypothetical protein